MFSATRQVLSRWPLAVVAVVAMVSAHALAQPTQEEVLRSISSSVSNSKTSGATLLLLFAAAVLLIVLLLLSQNRQRAAGSPKALNHHGKLLREVGKALSLKPPQVRRLKAMAEQQQVQSPLVLLLCPSILSSTAREEKSQLEEGRS